MDEERLIDRRVIVAGCESVNAAFGAMDTDQLQLTDVPRNIWAALLDYSVKKKTKRTKKSENSTKALRPQQFDFIFRFKGWRLCLKAAV